MGSEACAGLYAIFINNAERTESSMAIIVIPEDIPQRSVICYTANKQINSYDAKEKVWNVFSQP